MLHINRFPGAVHVRSQQPVIFRAGGSTGRHNVLGDGGGIGVGGINHQLELLFLKQRFHFRLGQPGSGHLYIGEGGQQGLTVFRCHTGIDLGVLPCQKFHQLPPLGGSGKHAQLTHPGILGG